LKLLFQVEGEVAITNSTTVRDAFGFRDSFLGLQSSQWGTVKVGKGDTPYKRALLAIDPLTNTLGDARALFGNTGGDNRVEFSLRAPHAIWYESPEWNSAFGTLQGTLMLSPGQNPDNNNQDWAFGETICAGGNPANGPGASGSGQAGIAGAVGSGTGDCNDGGFGTLTSANLTWKNNGYLVSLSGEYHDKANRTGDEAGSVPAGSVGARSEYGLQLIAGKDFGTVKTYVGADILRRDAINNAFNERSKEDYYLNFSWRFTENNVLGANFVYATRTPGDVQFFPQGDNSAEMAAVGVRHFFGKQLSTYVVGGVTDNHKTAHYDLGASALGQPILARGSNQGVAIPGKTIYGFSVGASYVF
jgi:predicted porin